MQSLEEKNAAKCEPSVDVFEENAELLLELRFERKLRLSALLVRAASATARHVRRAERRAARRHRGDR